MEQEQMQPADENGLESWIKPLFAGPIKLDDDTSLESLSEEFELRLEALFQLYNCEPTPTGWKHLALQLALGHVFSGTEVMKVVTPADRNADAAGRPPSNLIGYWIASIFQILNKDKSLSVKEAAKQFRKTHKDTPSVARLQNLISEARNGSRTMLPSLPWEHKIFAALYSASERLESASRK